MGYQPILSELETIQGALDADDPEQLDSALDRLTDEYDTVRPDERARIARLQIAREEADLTSDQRDVVNTYQRWNVVTYLARAGILTVGDMYLLDPEGTDATALREKVGELADRERNLAETTNEASEIASAVELSPRLAVLEFKSDDISPALGDTFALELLLENVGDEPATEVEITVAAPTFDNTQTASISTIKSGVAKELSFDLTASNDGEIEIEMTATSGNAGSVTETETINVRTKTGILRQAIETVAEVRDRVVSNSNGEDQTRAVTSKLDAAHQSLERALEEVERDRNKQANNAIRTATNQLGALLNSLEGKPNDGGKKDKNGKTKGQNENGSKGGNSIPHALERTITNQTELVIEHLADARDIDTPT